MSAKQDSAAAVRALILDKGLETEFLKASGLTSLDELDPKPEPSSKESEAPATVQHPAPSAAPVPNPEKTKSDADAKTKISAEVASDMLSPFIGINISYASRKKLSTYWPSSRMMFYIIHLLNAHLVDHYYFKRYCPDYHPYVLRLYYGILFYIQTLRAAADVKALPDDQHQFLIRFSQAHPPESLPIAGPLLTVFKSICTSQPEILSYGKVYPRIPSSPGPDCRSKFWNANSVAFMQPNVPAIFALLEHLNSQINGSQPIYPRKGRHLPVTADTNAPQIFGHHSFNPPSTRSTSDKWALVSAGIEYACEADSKLNEGFAERYENFDFPVTTADDNLQSVAAFLGLDKNMAWFSQVKDVAASAAAYCTGSGTLADCSPSGVQVNQIQVNYIKPDVDVAPPTQIADKKSLFQFSFTLSTTARSPQQLAEPMSAQTQTFVRMYPEHPFAGNFGDENHRQGEFWNVRPIEKSESDYESYLGLIPVVRNMVKARI